MKRYVTNTIISLTLGMAIGTTLILTVKLGNVFYGVQCILSTVAEVMHLINLSEK